MPFDLVDIILLLAAAQGLFLAVLILHRHRRLYANRFLGALILGYSLVLTHLFLDEMDFSLHHPAIPFIALGLVFLVGPLHYLYARYLTHNLRRFQKEDRVHFLPLLLYYIAGTVIFLIYKTRLTAIARSDHSEHIPGFYLAFNWFIIAYSAFYMVRILRVLGNFKKRLQDVFSSTEKIRLDWLRNITLLLAGTLTVFMIENALYLAGIDLSHQFTLSSTLVALYIYALGYLGLFKSEIFADPELTPSLNQMDDLEHRDAAKYGKSGLTPERAARYETSLKSLMSERKPYLNSDLTLNQLAGLLDISAHNLSEVINTRLGQNFFDFINTYRIEQAKRDLIDPDKKYLKVLAVALDAGFNSKTTFNTLFKKATGMTPSEYRSRQS